MALTEQALSAALQTVLDPNTGELMKNPVIRKIPCPAKKKSF